MARFLIAYDHSKRALLSWEDVSAESVSTAYNKYLDYVDHYRAETGVEVALLEAAVPDTLKSHHPEYFRRRDGGIRRWVSTAGKWFLLTLVAAVLGATLLLVLPPERTADWVRWHVTNRRLTGLPTCGDTAWLREVPVERVATWYQDYNRHTGLDTNDSDPRTAFVQNVRNDGKDYLVWILARPSHVRLICIRNGWARDYRTFYGTGRLKRIVVVGRHKEKPIPKRGCQRSQTLSDEPDDFGGYVRVEFSCQADDIRIDIKSYYPPGGPRNLSPKFKDNSVAISDVRLYE
jgi:hypothetical protein